MTDGTTTVLSRRTAWALALAAATTILCTEAGPSARAAPAANDTNVLLPAGISVQRPRALTTSAGFDADLMLQSVALDVAEHCVEMAGPVPDTGELVTHLEGLYDHVWAVIGPTWKYKTVIDENGQPVKVCYLVKTVLVKEDGDDQPVVVEFTEAMIY